MRIAIVNPITRTPLSYFKIPALENHDDVMIVNFAEYVASRGHEVDLFIAEDYRPRQAGREVPGVRFYYLATAMKQLFMPSTIPLMSGLSSHLRRTPYDVVISSEAFQPATLQAASAKKRAQHRSKLIVWFELARYHRFLFTIPARLYYAIVLLRFLDPLVDRYVPRGELARQFLAQRGVSPSKISAPISHGVDAETFFPDAIRRKEPVVYSPSRLVAAKRIDVLLRAFSIVHAERPELRLVIQGDGPLLQDSRQLAATLGLASAVEFRTERVPLDKMREAYCRALVTVFASRNDNKLLAAMESVACGTPVIISTGADTHAEFLDGQGGDVFPEGDFRALASSLLARINDEPTLQLAERQALDKSRFFQNEYLYGGFVDLVERVATGRTHDT